MGGVYVVYLWCVCVGGVCEWVVCMCCICGVCRWCVWVVCVSEWCVCGVCMFSLVVAIHRSLKHIPNIPHPTLKA